MTKPVASIALLVLFSFALNGQTPVVSQVGNGATFSTPATVGSYATIFGSNLAAPGTTAVANQAPWPTSLGGTSVRINGTPIPLSFVSPGQINAQIPWELAGQVQASINVTTASGTSSAATFSLGPNPAIFSVSPTGIGAGIFLHAGNSGVDAAHPALLGESVRLFSVGLGPVTNQPATGAATGSSSNPLPNPTLSIGGVAATIQSSQLIPPTDSQFLGIPVGAYEVTFIVPGSVTPGNAVNVSMSFGGVTSNTVTIPIIQAPSPSISSLVPASKVAGSAAFTLTVTGTNFNSTSVVQWKGSARTTTFVNPTQLTAAITAADIATPGSALVTVSNGGVVSSASSFAVVAVAVTPTPAALTFSAVEGVSPMSQGLKITTTNGSTFAAAATTLTGGNWLSVSPGAGLFPGNLSVSVDATALAAGTYSGSVGITAGGSVTSVAVTLTVAAAPAGQLNVSPPSLTVQAQVGGSPAPQNITIANTGGTTLNWTASATTQNGGPWLTVMPSSGSASLHAPSVAQASFNLQGLAVGVYDATITIAPGSIAIQVRLLVTPAGAAMVLGQTGLVLTGVAGSGTPPSQNVIVANVGGGTMNWTEALVRGNGIGPPTTNGTSAAQTSTLPVFAVQANTAGLASGSYYGLLQVAAPNAANSPQSVSVVLNLLPAGSTPPLRLFPQGLIFVAAFGGAAPPTQTITATTASSASTILTAAAATQSGGSWLSVSPVASTLSPSASLTVSASAKGLAVGLYSGTITVIPGDGSPPQDVTTYLVVTTGPQAEALGLGGAAACTPTKLVMVMRQLASNFSSPVGWPVNLEAQVLDDCGNLVTTATVIASFSNGDAPLSLVHLGNGIYSVTWKPSSSNPTAVTVRAIVGGLAPAMLTINGQVGANPAPPPSVSSGGVVNAASFAPGAELAPGTIVSVFGTNLGSSDNNLAGFPLPSTLGNIKLTIGGIDAPLFYAGKGQVNAQVPFEMTPGSQSQVTARAIPDSGAELDAVPEPIVIGSARPGIFIAGGTQGAILNVSNQVVDASHPATAGDVIVIFCTGLGATDPPALTGQPAASGVAVVQPSVTVGGVPAPLQYAGVAPGFVGLFQVNVVIPAGAGSGPSVPVVLTQNGVASNMATIVVR